MDGLIGFGTNEIMTRKDFDSELMDDELSESRSGLLLGVVFYQLFFFKSSICRQ